MKIRKKLLRKHLLGKKTFLSKKKNKKTRTDLTLGLMVKAKLYRQKSHREAYTYPLTKKGKGEKLIYPAPKVHLLNLG